MGEDVGLTAKNGAETSCKWTEGNVDTNDDHIKIRFGEEPRPVALVAADGKNSFTVQFLFRWRRGDIKSTRIRREVCKDLDFYLIEKGEKDPWAYAIHHCSTTANVYADVHWSCHSKGRKD